jgi:hypothetical protein
MSMYTNVIAQLTIAEEFREQGQDGKLFISYALGRFHRPVLSH